MAKKNKMAAIRHLEFRGPVMGSLKSPYRTFYTSPIETIALNCLVFDKIAFLCTHFGDKQTDGQTDEQTDGQNQRIKGHLAIASGASSYYAPARRVIIIINRSLSVTLLFL